MNYLLKIYNKLKNTIIYGTGVSIQNTKLGHGVYIAHHAEIVDSYIGDHSSIGRYDKIRAADIGKYCSISWDCTIGAPTHPFKTAASCALTYRREYGLVDKDVEFFQKRTVIGNDVWIGCNAIIISGVNIGNGAVVAAGAVCTHDIPPYEIWAGIPAKKISDRYGNSDYSERINNLKWWDWPLERQRMALELFKRDVNEMVLTKLEEIAARDSGLDA